jgi:hypothetical protein
MPVDRVSSEVWHAVGQARLTFYALRATWENFWLPENNMKIKTNNKERINIGIIIIICIVSRVCFPYIMRNKISDNERKNLF